MGPTNAGGAKDLLNAVQVSDQIEKIRVRPEAIGRERSQVIRVAMTPEVVEQALNFDQTGGSTVVEKRCAVPHSSQRRNVDVSRVSQRVGQESSAGRTDR